MEKRTAFIKTKWKYVLVAVLAFAAGGSLGFIQSPAHTSTVDHQLKQEGLETANNELAAKVEELEAANNESDEQIKELKAQMRKMETSSQKEAVARAENFLKYSPFSERGLIDQLIVMDFSEDDAAYAVQSLDVDWRTYAVEVAEGYIEYGSFSRTELIDQLKADGYREEDAVYAVDSVGL